MARSVVERYLVAAFAFMAAATWFGVGLQKGFTCLLVFVLALHAARLYQRRKESRSHGLGNRRDRRPRYDPASHEPRDMSPSAASKVDRPQRSTRLFDGGREETGWSVASEATW